MINVSEKDVPSIWSQLPDELRSGLAKVISAYFESRIPRDLDDDGGDPKIVDREIALMCAISDLRLMASGKNPATGEPLSREEMMSLAASALTLYV